MKQSVIMGRPPIFDECRAKFGPAVDRAIFSWGGTVYNPFGWRLPAQLLAHEAVHGERQIAIGIEAWWRRYLDDADFRLAEEIPAHIAEYRAIARIGNRNQRRLALNMISHRLAGALYGRVITVAAAKDLIKKGAQ